MVRFHVPIMGRMGLGIFFTYMNGINSMVNVGNILQSHGASVGRYWVGLGDGWVEWEYIYMEKGKGKHLRAKGWVTIFVRKRWRIS